MYDVIIIDDEPWTIIDIERTFSLENMGFKIAGSYRSPLKALPAIVQTKPDLIITDIRMSGMSGIELMKKVREHKIQCEFIVVSGYSEFAYAQSAITYGACGYCLKPLNPEDAMECLNRAKAALDKKNSKPVPAPLAPADELLDNNFEKFLNYMNVHFSEHLTLKELAAAFHMNPNYCCSLFTKYTGKTFSRYLTDLRTEEARDLLTKSDHSLEEIASLVGFKDYFYFSKVFKKSCGYSPKEYRKIMSRQTGGYES